MKVLQVQTPGLLTTVQDLGREGFGPMGVSPSGAADPISLRMGNRLVGNAEGAAALEMTLLGGTFVFPEGAVLALTGSDFGATLDEKPVESWTPFEAKPRQTLSLGPSRSGARCYLCVRGGIVVKDFLGSVSTHLLSGLGGHEGRALRKGDMLKIGEAQGSFRKRTLAVPTLERLSSRKVLRVTPGPQSDWFPDSSQKILCSSAYRVAEASNRMGIRLLGEAIPMFSGHAGQEETGRNACSTSGAGEMISEGVSLGAIQVPEGGLPIILFVEQQTTGGYAKIANVISADLSSLGQLRPRDEIRFEQVDWDTARSLLIEQERLLASKELIFP
jgi:antagonist of KipI